MSRWGTACLGRVRTEVKGGWSSAASIYRHSVEQCTVSEQLARRRCSSGGESGPVGRPAPGAVEVESAVRRGTVLYRGCRLIKMEMDHSVLALLKSTSCVQTSPVQATASALNSTSVPSSTPKLLVEDTINGFLFIQRITSASLISHVTSSAPPSVERDSCLSLLMTALSVETPNTSESVSRACVSL